MSNNPDNQTSGILRFNLSIFEAKVYTQIDTCCRAQHNQGRFASLPKDMRENIVMAFLTNAMKKFNNPKLNVAEVKTVFFSDNGMAYMDIDGRFTEMLNVAEARAKPAEESLSDLRNQTELLILTEHQQQINHGR